MILLQKKLVQIRARPRAGEIKQAHKRFDFAKVNSFSNWSSYRKDLMLSLLAHKKCTCVKFTFVSCDNIAFSNLAKASTYYLEYFHFPSNEGKILSSDLGLCWLRKVRYFIADEALGLYYIPMHCGPILILSLSDIQVDILLGANSVNLEFSLSTFEYETFCRNYVHGTLRIKFPTG
jgi:hypothetical protein